MPLLTAIQNTQPDYVAIAMVAVIAVIVAILVIRKRILVNRKKDAVVVQPVPEPVAEKPAAPGSAGQVKLYDVEPKTAAMLMAIVANKMGKQLNELRFISIREVE